MTRVELRPQTFEIKTMLESWRKGFPPYSIQDFGGLSSRCLVPQFIHYLVQYKYKSGLGSESGFVNWWTGVGCKPSKIQGRIKKSF